MAIEAIAIGEGVLPKTISKSKGCGIANLDVAGGYHTQWVAKIIKKKVQETALITALGEL